MKFFEKYLHNLNLALEAVIDNRFRSMLTALGIIFGVAAVIAMLAIGNGARQEILDQMKMVGVNNIIIRPIYAEDDRRDDLSEGRFSPGLTLQDVESISRIVPTVRRTSPEVQISAYAMKGTIRRPVRVAGVTPEYFEVFSLDLPRGSMFTPQQLKDGAPVAIIGNNIRAIFFGNTDPVGRQIKAGNNWLTVIGVVEDRMVTEDAVESLGVSEFNNVIYTPVQTMLLRFRDRSAVSIAEIRQTRTRGGRRGGMVVAGRSNNNGDDDDERYANYHQLDRVVVQVDESSQLIPTADVIRRMLERRHNQVEDFEVIIPELLLEQEQRTRDIFNIVLGAIAGISLVVGGIGIMNIMLASVMERTREIGVRLAVGAKKTDVVFQFLSESILISVAGGILGVFLGIGLSRGIMQFTDILTIVSLSSVLISFGVAAAVGILFGYMPAKKAAEKDPVASLRYE